MKVTDMKKQNRKDWLWACLFILPTVGGLYVFFLYPMVYSIYISLTKWNHLIAPKFVGLANYIRLFKDEGVYKEFFNTFFFVIVLVPLIIIISLLMANMMKNKSALTGFCRTGFFLPYVLLPVVCAMVWLIIFNSRYGLINTLLRQAGLPEPSWLSDQWLVRIAVVVIGIWASVGYYTVLILAGLQNIPQQYYEASEIEGAGEWRQFFHITIPLVSPQLFFSTVIAVITTFKMFDYIFIFGKGNPIVLDNIRTMAFGIYERGFTYLEMGYASAEAILFCTLILIVTLFQQIGQKNWVHYG
jgi:multiple sugar transport system permease protein